MKITDACVYPYPCGDSSVRRMALEAKALGFDRLVADDTPSGEYYGIEILLRNPYPGHCGKRSHKPHQT